MKVFLNRKQVNGPWGGGAQFVQAFNRLAPQFGVKIVEDPLLANVLLVLGFDGGDTGFNFLAAQHLRDSGHNNVKVIVRINENDARKATEQVDNSMNLMTALSDGTVYVSNWLKNAYYAPTWRDKSILQLRPYVDRFENAAVIINGVDRNVFYPNRSASLRLYDCARLCIVAHHWSNNPMKGFDAYDAIDRLANDDNYYEFHYIGRHRDSFKGKNTTLTPACFGEALGRALGDPRQLHNVYVSASRFDPGPNHVLEALACGLETFVHSDGGGAVEFAGADHTFSSNEELLTILDDFRCGRRLHSKNAFIPPTWETCIEQYVKYMETMCKSR